MNRAFVLLPSMLAFVCSGCATTRGPSVQTVPVVLPAPEISAPPVVNGVPSRPLGQHRPEARAQVVRIAPVAPVDRGAPRRLLRRRVDLDLRSASVADVFRLLADTGDINVVLAEGVAGEVTLRLRRVTLRDALVAVAATHSLDLSWQGNILFVRPAC